MRRLSEGRAERQPEPVPAAPDSRPQQPADRDAVGYRPRHAADEEAVRRDELDEVREAVRDLRDIEAERAAEADDHEAAASLTRDEDLEPAPRFGDLDAILEHRRDRIAGARERAGQGEYAGAEPDPPLEQGRAEHTSIDLDALRRQRLADPSPQFPPLEQGRAEHTSIDRARDTLAPVFHWAALYRKPMRDARNAVLELASTNEDPVHPGRRVKLGELIIRDLQKHRHADSTAAPVLSSVMSTSDREIASILSTASRALQVYQNPHAIASTEDPNFDPAAFVAGQYGRSTVYIMSSNENQEFTAPLVVAFLNQIRQEQYRQQRQFAHEQMARRGNPEQDWLAEFKADMANRTQSTSTTVFALDEMYGIAPIPDLPNMLSEGGSQGVIVAGAVQDLALIKDRWRQAGESFLTLFQDVLVFPGIRHGQTLDVVSTLIGDYDRPVPQTTTGGGPQGANWSETTNIQRQRRMPPDAVYAGPDPGNQDVLLHLSSQGTGQLFATPYWRASPWPQVITDCMELALGGGESMWAQYVRMMGGTPDEPPLTDLPIPDLTSWANRHRGRDPWAERYLAAKQRWDWR